MPYDAEGPHRGHGTRWAPWALASVSMTWGANYTVNSWGLREFTVPGFNALRFLLAAPLLLVLARWTEGTLRVEHGQWPRLLLSAAVGIVGYQLAFSAAVRLSTPAAAALLIALSPFFTALFARLAGEHATLPARRAAAAGTVAFAGVVLVVLGQQDTAAGPAATKWYGSVLALLASALWGWYPVVTRPLLKHHSPLHVTAWTSAAGTAFLVPLAAIAGFTLHGTVRQPLSWFSLGYSVLLVTVVGLVVWYRAVGQVGSAAVMLWMFAVPVAAALFAALTGEQRITWPQTAGSALVLVALAYAQGLSFGTLRNSHRRTSHRTRSTTKERNPDEHHPGPGTPDRAGRH
ncbi:DMT family transporter [Streptomyces canus]|uniref:DMT family transporter n=1 Tax=Streptomyces canus TaxID=58343 RepID=UPI0036BFC6E5